MGKSTQFSAERRSRNRVWLVAMLVVLGVAAGGLWFAQQQGMLRVASEDTSVNASQGSVAVDGGSASQQSVDDRSTEGSDQSASETDLGTSEVAPQLSVEPATETAATPAGQSQSAAADRLAKAQALITAVEQALADADAEEAQAQLHALQSLAPNHAALAGLRDRLALLQDVQDARGRAHIALSEGEPGRALGMIAVLDVSGVASPERDRVQALRADAAYVQQMLSTAVQALARNDLETARQCYLDAFNRAENRAARRGLEVVPLCHQFTDALSAGSISKAAGLLGEIEGMGMPDAVLAPRRTELEVHQLVANMRRLIQAYDFDGAQKSLERLRVVDPEAHQIDQLAHAIELGRRMAAFNHSLAARDLAAAQRDLALIRDLDGEGPAWQDAHGRLQASQLEEEAAAQKITDLATLAHDAIVAEHPDWDAIERAIERVQAEAGVDAAVVTELKSLAADRRLREVLLARLSALDEAVVTGDRVKVESLVHDADHAAALLFFVGREELVFEHQLTNLERGDLMAATMVTLTVASKAYPEAVVTSRYQWKVVDGQWVIEVSELQ